MNFQDLILISLRAIASNGLRSLLTTLGIIIGVSSVIILMSVGQGAVKGVIDELNALGTNLIFIEPGSSEEDGQKGAAGSAIQNINVMSGFDEMEVIMYSPLTPV